MTHPATRMNKVQVVRGQTKVLQIKVKTKAGRAAKLAGATLFMTVRKKPDSPVLITKTSGDGIAISDADKGEATITLNINDTNIEAGQYRYDVWVQYDVPNHLPTRQPVVRFAELEVIDGLTDFPDTNT